MTVLWSTAELPGVRWDPEPDDEDNGPWCRREWADLLGQRAELHKLATMTTIDPTGDFL
ncbi:hypothetical protein [Streptomyces prunicolor]